MGAREKGITVTDFWFITIMLVTDLNLNLKKEQAWELLVEEVEFQDL